MIQEFVRAALFIFAAEMGDKSQILAMAFALQFPIRKVMSGIALGAFLNHGLAVALGAYLALVIPIEMIRLVASLGFLGFGLWTLAQPNDSDEFQGHKHGHPTLVVATAFFIGELGDKTQLTAIALSSNANFPIAVLIGTVTGMILTSMVGIFVGIKFGERIPGMALKLVSGGVFILFGLYGLWTIIPPEYFTFRNIALFLGILVLLIIILVVPPLLQHRKRRSGQMQRLAGELRRRLLEIEEAVDHICLGVRNCRRCRGQGCPVGYCKELVMQAIKEEGLSQADLLLRPFAKRSQHFDDAKIRHALQLIRENNQSCVGDSDIECVLERTEEVLQALRRSIRH